MKNRLDTVVSLAMLAMAAAALLMLRDRQHEPERKLITRWSQVTDGVVLHGDPRAAKNTLVFFSDFECPYCRAFSEQLDTIIAERPDLAIVLQHLTSPAHPHAEKAAVAFECARSQGVALPMFRALFVRQDSLAGDLAPAAIEAGVPDLSRWMQCTSSPPSAFALLATGRKLAEDNGITGTPSIWLNGKGGTAYESMDRVRDHLNALH